MQDDFPEQENKNNRKRVRIIYITVLIAVSVFCAALLAFMYVSGRYGNAPDGQKNSGDTDIYRYTYAGGNDEWTAKFEIAGTEKWTNKNNLLGYDGSYDTLLTVSFKGDLTELSSVRHLIISYKMGNQGGTIDQTYDEGSGARSSYSESSSSGGAYLYSEGDVYIVTINLDGIEQTIGLHEIK